MKKFQFSVELRKELKDNGKAWDDLLFRACMEAKAKEVKASTFAETLRKTGFRCGTGPARAAYKAVRDGKDKRGMVDAITAVKAKRKAKGTAKGTNNGTDNGTDNGTNNGTNNDANNDANTLVGALEAALEAAKSGHLEVAETWLIKAKTMLEVAKEQAKVAEKTAKAS